MAVNDTITLDDHLTQQCGGLFNACPHCDEERAERIKAATRALPVPA